MKRICLWTLMSVLGFSWTVMGAAGAAEKYPRKPITFIMPYEAESGVSTLTRKAVEIAEKKLGVSIIYVNKPGAAGVIGGKDIYNAKPDGYTVGGYAPLVINRLQGLYPYGQRDFDMIGLIGYAPVVIICNAKTPWKSVKELIDYAKEHPKEVKAATSAKGAYYWVAARIFEEATGAKLNIIPQPGGGGMGVVQTAGGHTDIAFSDFMASKPLLESGNIRLLGIMATTRFSGKYSQIPTLKDVGYPIEGGATRVIVGPKGMPKDAKEKLMAVFGEAAQSAEFRDFCQNLFSVPLWLPGERGIEFYDQEEATLRPIFQAAGLIKEAK
jgi:tripartite-type tricarboxylate transporter receptor subunit TctC